MARDYSKKILATFVIVLLLATAFVVECVNFGGHPSDNTPYYIDQDDVYYSPPLLANDNRQFGFSMFVDDAVSNGFSPLDKKIARETDSDGLVYANPRTKKWVLRGDPRGHKLLSTVTRQELMEIGGRKPDQEHAKRGGFQDWCGPFKWGLRKLGLAKPRWNGNGEWNW